MCTKYWYKERDCYEITYVLRDFKMAPQFGIHIYCDNQFSIYMVENPVYHEKRKHVDVDCDFNKIYFQDGLIKLPSSFFLKIKKKNY